MINFFRRIRKQLADDNKPLKYMRYAIGEIVLVVIGILIALSINNWNEDKKQHLNNIKFLRNLQHEVAADTLVLLERIEDYTEINEDLIQIKNLLNNRVTLTKNEHELISLNLWIIEILTPVYKNAQMNDFKIGDGTLESISNDLNRSYHSYIETTQSNNDIVGKLGESLQSIVSQDIHPKVDLDYRDNWGDGKKNLAHFDFEKIRNDRSFKNAINRSIYYRMVSIGNMSYQKKLANEVLENLNHELKKSE